MLDNIKKSLLSKEKWKQKIKNKNNGIALVVLISVFLAYFFLNKGTSIISNPEAKQKQYELAKTKVSELDDKIRNLKLNQKAKQLNISNWHSKYLSILDYSVTSFSLNTYLVDIRSQKRLLFPANQPIVLVKTKNENEEYYVFKDILFKRLEK